MNIANDGKLLYITSVDISLPKGPSVNEREFASVLHETFGDRVHMLITEPTNPLAEISKYNVTFLRNYSNSYGLSYLLHQIDLYRKASKLLDTQRYDLIITRVRLLCWGLAFVLKKHDIPLAIKHLSGYPREFAQGQRGLKRLAGEAAAPLHARLLRKLSAQAIAIDACTQGHVRGIMHNLNVARQKIILIENATNTDKFKPRDTVAARAKCKLPDSNPVVGFVGGRPWERGGTEMVKVAPRLIAKYPNLGFVIVGGEGKGMDRLLKLAREYAVLDHFVFPGVVPYDEVPDYVNAFDVGIAFDRTDRFDTIGNSNQKIRQYVASGKPVVVTPGGNEFIAENGLGSVVDLGDIAQIEQAISFWLGLTTEERKLHEKRAAAYARENLSTHKMLKKRVEFWDARLASAYHAPLRKDSSVIANRD